MARTGEMQPVVERLEGRTLLAVFTVTNTNNSGPGSLRQAILDANADSGQDSIHFNLASDLASKQIRPRSPLPAVTDDLVIDGTTQPGYSRKPIIEINGKLAGSGTSGLTLEHGASIINGLSITSFSGSGIMILSDKGCTITRNHIGADPTGLVQRGNSVSGISIAGSSGNMIGGTDAANGNLIAFNNGPGVLMYGGGTGNAVLSNLMHSNQGLGIDLVKGDATKPDGVNFNDANDADTGTNNLQNSPTIATVTTTYDGGTRITGSFQGKPQTLYRFEVFGNPANNVGSVAARTFIGVFTRETYPNGSVILDATFPRSSAALVTVSVTDNQNNTSELTVARFNVAGSISGNVFDDRNGNGTRENGEPNLSNQIVYSDRNGNGTFETAEPYAITDGKGNYTIKDAYGGPHRVRVAVPPNWRLTSPDAEYWDLSLPSRKTKGRNFGLTTTAIVKGTVFNDADKDGVRDSGETGLSGWTVYIDANNNGVLDSKEQSAKTDSQGAYKLTGMLPGTYVVRVAPKSGYTLTAPADGRYVLKLLMGSSRSKRDFGLHAV